MHSKARLWEVGVVLCCGVWIGGLIVYCSECTNHGSWALGRLEEYIQVGPSKVECVNEPWHRENVSCRRRIGSTAFKMLIPNTLGDERIGIGESFELVLLCIFGLI